MAKEDRCNEDLCNEDQILHLMSNGVSVDLNTVSSGADT